MARPKILESSTHLCLLLVTIIHAATAISYSSYSSLCHFPVPSPDLHTGNHSHSTATASTNLPARISTGHFSGGDELLFVPERSYAVRSFSFIPRRSALTTDPTVVRLVATLALEGSGVGSPRREHHHSVTFELEGYYSTATSSAELELCMVGSGSYARDDGTGTDVLLSDVALRLHLPRPSSLSQPFVTGRLEGAGFGAITLVAYVDSHSDSDGDYAYAETAATCPPPVTPARDGQHVLSAGFSCSRLRELLRGSYNLEYMPGRGGHESGSSPLQLRHRLMHVNQMSCGTDGGIRAYIPFYANPSDSFPTSQFIVGDEALVAEGFWDSSRSQLCLRACGVVRSGLSRADLAVGECGIGVSFWFPATWSFQHRKTMVGLIWNSSRTSDGDTVVMSSTTSASRSAGYMGDFSDIKYNYTLVEMAKEHYHSNPVLSKDRNGSFPGNHSCRDFAFHFKLKKPKVRGYAWPVTIGSAVVKEDRLMPDDLFSRRVAAEVSKQRLLNVSYDMEYWVADVKWRINAEGVYDTKTGSLCMVACQVGNGSSDCQVLVTVQFVSVQTTEARERVVGTISSLRTKSDPLFFEALELESQVQGQRESRMDTEIIMLVLSPALFAVVLILQLRHAKKHPEAAPSMSITMLAALALGSLIPLMLDFEPTIKALQDRFDPLWTWTWYRIAPNRFPLRAGTMLAFLLQLRLLQLALSGRRPSEPGRGGDGSSAAAAEWRTLQTCLLLHFLGAVLMLIANRGDGLPRLLIGATEPTPADVLVSYGGLVLDGFLLPQVISNAFSGAKARAISPWFYVGGTAIRAAPHAYDLYAGPRGHLFGGAALDVAVLFGMALLAVLLFLQQRVRVRGAFVCSSSKRRSGAYRMVSIAS